MKNTFPHGIDISTEKAVAAPKNKSDDSPLGLIAIDLI